MRLDEYNFMDFACDTGTEGIKLWGKRIDCMSFTKAKPLTYLAGPYSAKGESDPEKIKEIQETRFRQLTTIAARLMKQFPNLNVFSPITHSHPMHALAGMRGDWTFWKKIDTEFIGLCGLMIVAKLPGWLSSTGVTAEIELAREFGIPILFLMPDRFLK